MSVALSRAEHGRPAPPVRIIHLGIGNFTRAHQAWYTEHAADADQWGIAGFPGRTTLEPRACARDDALDAQQGLYTLMTQHADRDEIEVIGSVSRTFRSHDHQAWTRLFADPQVAIVTSTITEAGYRRDARGDLDLDDPGVVADLKILRRGDLDTPVFTGPAKFVRGLMARRRSGGGAITFVPCDNVPSNGAMAQRVIRQAAAHVDPGLVPWIDQNVGFVTTMVDRITPRATLADIDSAEAASGIRDEGLVVTEPFSEWVLAGEFRAGRPDWESSGARFVDDVEPHEKRKLYLLNGSHSLMAYCGSVLGHQTVFDAIGDERVFAWVNDYWDDAVRVVPLPEAEKQAYRQALLDRYRNPRIRHLLGQIVADGSQKMPIRIVPTITSLLARGVLARGATRAVAGWILHLRGQGASLEDATADEVLGLASGQLVDAAARVVHWLGIDDPAVVAQVVAQAEEMAALTC